jgi:methyltransferase (TIGR00027 family)
VTERVASRTATGVAVLHVAHQIVDSEPRVLDDPVIGDLMGLPPDYVREHADKFQSRGARGLRAHVVTRTRFAEDRLRAAVARGVRQYIVLGAGLDTFAYRQPEWARGIRVFEIDQPGTQTGKRYRVTVAGIAVPENVTYVAIDFEAEALADGLRRGGVNLDEPAFFAWLGVTMYLTEPAIDAVLKTVVAFPRGSEIVLTFTQPKTAEDVQPDGVTLAERAAEVGEPWVTFFEPPQLEAKLHSLGFSAVEFLTFDDAVARYFQNRADGLLPPRKTSIVSATV